MSASILIVDDEAAVLRTLARYFQRAELEVFQAMTAREAAELYDSHRPDLALVDLHLPDLSGLELLEILHGRGATVMMLTGHGDIETAVRAVKAGAENFLTKPVNFEHLEAVVERALEKVRLKRAQSYRKEHDDPAQLAALGKSPRMRAIAAEVRRLAEAERTTVLLLGESGTGKGWVAEWLHKLSPRRDRPFVDINCATLTGTFLETELFGHEKGAFTDAKTMKRGLFEIADGGTLFLDEIGELDLTLQPKLLKVLEARSFRRVGGTREVTVDVRLITASNRDIEAAVAAGDFREDLFYRLNVMPLQLPPLRERAREDVAEVALRVFDELKRELPRGAERLSADALHGLAAYHWPGNVRELRNVLERAHILAGEAQTLELHHLPEEIHGREGSLERPGADLADLQEVERRHIEKALRRCGGNRSRTAKVLGISRATLHNKINKFGMERVGLD